ncbi:MAG: HD domain-containing protein [Candidatus Omnitrophota bacterium]|nr:HD domain-containing protein [Candidatus Omnitrophota bacterium]
MIFSCSGSEKFKKPQPENICCPSCAEEVEIWTDEIEALCPKCNTKVTRPQEQSCLDWCSYAKECVGAQKYTLYMHNKATSIKEKLLRELKDYFTGDIKRINHAKNVMHFAEELLKQEKADWHIVIPASILHDAGIKVAEAKYGSTAGHYQEKEGPPIARKILLKVGLKKEDIEEICEIIAHHHSPGIVSTQNFKVLYDADWLVNLKDEIDTKDRDKLKVIIDKVFLTNSGKILAEKIYLSTPFKIEH